MLKSPFLRVLLLIVYMTRLIKSMVEYQNLTRETNSHYTNDKTMHEEVYDVCIL